MIGQFLVRGVMYEPIFKRNTYSFSLNSAAATNKSISTEKAIKWSVIVIFSLSNSYKAHWSVCSNNNNDDDNDNDNDNDNNNNKTIRCIFLVLLKKKPYNKYLLKNNHYFRSPYSPLLFLAWEFMD